MRRSRRAQAQKLRGRGGERRAGYLLPGFLYLLAGPWSRPQVTPSPAAVGGWQVRIGTPAAGSGASLTAAPPASAAAPRGPSPGGLLSGPSPRLFLVELVWADVHIDLPDEARCYGVKCRGLCKSFEVIVEMLAVTRPDPLESDIQD